jgi:anti-sigma-K factor RskA
MENKDGPREMSEAHLLAPWYVTGKLDEDEARELDELAKDDPELALLIEEAKREAKATTALNEALGDPPQALWDRIERSIEAQTRAERSAQRAGLIAGVKNSVSSFFGGLSMPQWQAVAAAAIGLCIIQAGAIGYLAYNGGEPAKFGVAGGPKTGAEAKSAFIVSFSDKATVAQVSALLDDAGLSIVDGPNADLIYHLGLRDDKVQTKEGAYQKLRSSAAVKLVLREK